MANSDTGSSSKDTSHEQQGGIIDTIYDKLSSLGGKTPTTGNTNTENVNSDNKGSSVGGLSAHEAPKKHIEDFLRDQYKSNPEEMKLAKSQPDPETEEV